MAQDIIIALGSNIGQSAEIFSAALQEISERIGLITSVSPWFETAPLVLPNMRLEEQRILPNMRLEEQRNYLNGVLIARSDLAPFVMLSELMLIESHLGRRRENEHTRWQSRIIDLDLIAISEEQINITGLSVPHPEMHKRDFVLRPLVAIAPEWKHPFYKKTASELLSLLRMGET